MMKNNKKYEISFQLPRDRIVGQAVSSVLSQSNFTYALPYIERAMKGEACSYENKFLMAEGLRWIHVNFVPNFDDLGKQQNITTWLKKLEQSKQSGTSFIPMEVTVRCKNGTDKIVIVSTNSVSCGPMEDVTLVVLYDITTQKRAQEELLSMNDTLEDRVNERTMELSSINRKLEFYINEIEQFNYIASHDLREPLLTLTNFTQLIQEEYDGKLDETGN